MKAKNNGNSLQLVNGEYTIPSKYVLKTICKYILFMPIATNKNVVAHEKMYI